MQVVSYLHAEQIFHPATHDYVISQTAVMKKFWLKLFIDTSVYLPLVSFF